MRKEEREWRMREKEKRGDREVKEVVEGRERKEQGGGGVLKEGRGKARK